MRHRAFLLIAVLAVSSPAMGWHDSGHKATARIAFDQLTTQRQLEILEIIKSHPRFEEDFFAQMPKAIADGEAVDRARWALERASVWPDMMRDVDEETRARFHRSRWHYINLPVWLTPRDREVLDGKLDHNMSRSFAPPLRQNLNAVQALRGNIEVWRNPQASDEDKAVALCWILHIAGDLHQPLHTVALFSEAWFPRGDRGGNRIQVVWTPENSNLHAVWDGLPTDMATLEPTDNTVALIEKDVVNDAAIDEWVEQHAALAERFVYTESVTSQLLIQLRNREAPLVELDQDYLAPARMIARQQVNLAGHRIAALIE